MPVADIHVDAGVTEGDLCAFASYFGSDEVNLAYYPQGSALLKKLGSLGDGQTYFRTHNLLTTGDDSRGLVGVPGMKWGSTNAYVESGGQPVYDFGIIDRIFDAYLNAGIKPYVQIGFMPRALSSHPDPYFFDFIPGKSEVDSIFTGWAYPPRDYAKWEELVYRWVKHQVSRYGQFEVESWWFETWNEPNIGYWQGTREEFFRTHDHAINGVKRALPTARVGGPELAGGLGRGWMKDFLDHCLTGKNFATGKIGTPLDFVSFHAKGQPKLIEEDQHVRMGLAPQLKELESAFDLFSQYPQLKGIPVLVGEMDPDGYGYSTDPMYGYRNGLMFPAYTAAAFVRALDVAAKYRVNLRGLLTWSFEYETTPLMPNEDKYFDPYRVVSTQGIDKPILNVLRMFAMMSGDGFQRIKADSTAQTPLDQVLEYGVRTETDIGVFASRNGNSFYVLVWHYHDDNLEFPPASCRVALDNLPRSKATLRHYRIDEEHSNAYRVWQRMGSPQKPTEEQKRELDSRCGLEEFHPPRRMRLDDGYLKLEFELPIRAISLFVLQCSE